jgi:hypothetical protein
MTFGQLHRVQEEEEEAALGRGSVATWGRAYASCMVTSTGCEQQRS